MANQNKRIKVTKENQITYVPSLRNSTLFVFGSESNFTAPKVTPFEGCSRNVLYFVCVLTEIGKDSTSSPLVGSNNCKETCLFDINCNASKEQNVITILAKSFPAGSIVPSIGDMVNNFDKPGRVKTNLKAILYFPVLFILILFSALSPTHIIPKSTENLIYEII